MISLTYRIAQSLSYLYLKLFHRLTIIGLENIPKQGSFILACNHASYIDPPAVGCRVNRNLHYFARDSLFVGPLGFLIRRLNAIPVNRDRMELKTLKNILAVLRNGNPLLVFPEGTRTVDGKVGPGKKGIGLLITKAKCGVIPVRIEGANKILGKGMIIPRLGKKLTIKYGKFIDYSCFEELDKNDLQQKISDLILNKIINIEI